MPSTACLLLRQQNEKSNCWGALLRNKNERLLASSCIKVLLYLKGIHDT